VPVMGAAGGEYLLGVCLCGFCWERGGWCFASRSVVHQVEPTTFPCFQAPSRSECSCGQDCRSTAQCSKRLSQIGPNAPMGPTGCMGPAKLSSSTVDRDNFLEEWRGFACGCTSSFDIKARPLTVCSQGSNLCLLVGNSGRKRSL